MAAMFLVFSWWSGLNPIAGPQELLEFLRSLGPAIVGLAVALV